jgi:hypothetical protein
MFMKKITIIALAVSLNLGIAVMAQTPSITGVGDYDGSTPTMNDYYWSIYGSNLSNRTGGPGTASSIVSYEWVLSDGYDYYGNCCIAEQSGTDNTPTYWYESPSQINFYFSSFGLYIYDPMEGQDEYYFPVGIAGVTVTNSNNQSSSQYRLDYDPS